MGAARHEVAWVNIVGDADAEEFVARHRGGDATVPTAFTGAGEMISASPAAIKAHLRAAGSPG